MSSGMTPAEAFAECEGTVRRFDADRYFASLFAPANKRPLLYALYAFNHELARAGEAAREPVMAEIRLQWWRDALQAACEGRPWAHPAAVGLVEVLSHGSVTVSALEALINDRDLESSSTPFATLVAMESHAGATSAALMQIATRILDAGADAAEVTREAGIAYGLAGMLRSLPFQALRGKLFLPLDLLAVHSLSISDAFSQKRPAELKRVVSSVISTALEHFARARQIVIPGKMLPAVLPASLVPAYLSRLANSLGPLRDESEISQLRRQLILLRAALLKRV
jgi:15-cis-phytoene synthase